MSVICLPAYKSCAAAWSEPEPPTDRTASTKTSRIRVRTICMMVLPALAVSSETAILEKYSVSIYRTPQRFYNFTAFCPERARHRAFGCGLDNVSIGNNSPDTSFTRLDSYSL